MARLNIFLRHKYKETLSRNETPAAITKGYKRKITKMYKYGCDKSRQGRKGSKSRQV